MTKKHSAKKALPASLLSLLLCVSMLVGTTFAWFTDSVTSGRNTIQSGNLDVVLEYWDGDSYEEVTSTTKLFNDAALWEPGYTEVAYLKVSNAGSLALKYQLAVTIYNEVLGKTEAGSDIKLSDYLQFKVVESDTDLADTYARETAQSADATATKLQTYNSDVKALEPKNEQGDNNYYDYVALIIYMPTTVGNEANHDGVNIPSVEMGVDLFATQYTSEEDSFDNQYDKNAIIVTNAAEAQAALDNAEPGTMIKLAPGVNYGTLVVRPVLDAAHTESGDWFTGNYRTELARTIENVTIVGAAGAKVDAIKIDTGYKGSSYYAEAPDLMCYANIKNFVIDGVEFTDNTTDTSYNAPIYIDLMNINLDGLTVKNCKLNGTNDKSQLVYIYGSQGNHTFATASKNVTITGNTVDGIGRLCELRETENVTITGNTIKNAAEHGILLSCNTGNTYSGNVTVSGNTAYGINNRFVRMAGAGDAVVVIKNNTITNYLGVYDDYIKVTDGTNVTIENNPMTRAYKVASVDEIKTILAQETDGTTIFLKAGNYENLSFVNPASFKAKNLTLIGEEGVVIDGISFHGEIGGSNWRCDTDGLTIKNVTFSSGLGLGSVEHENILVENCKFINNARIVQNASPDEKLYDLTVKNCTFEGNDTGTITAIALDDVTNLTVTGCTFTNIQYNAIQVNVKGGKVVIENNNITGTGDRALRIAHVAENVEIVISGNTITDSARVKDGKKQVICIGNNNGVPATSSITFTDNTYDGAAWAEGMVIANTTVETIICSDNTRIDG